MITRPLGSFGGAVRACSVIAVLKVVGAEHVLEGAGVSEAARTHAEADVLGKNARCDIHRERCYVRIDWLTPLPGTHDVRWVIEQPLPFEGRPS